ncbi:PREDICTED: putative POM121-like protein 1 [Galeopterus variegatus]|uniref:POM121-like protein 1 n=1 Tax=Galeopterus variegatus TaxID=482537 RepID=A0ABM0SFE1_GALVR|nr:PREDICTED: putative POM121-like protein 1 [Galeopterus variegatus]
MSFSSTASCAQDSCTARSVTRALGESIREKAEQEKDPKVIEKQEGERRGPEGADTGCTQSAFRPFRVNAALSSFLPRHGPLQRNLREGCWQPTCKMPHTCCLSSCPQRNAITSSYSSTSSIQLPQSRKAQASKVRKEGPQLSILATEICQRKSPGAATGQELPSKISSPTVQSSRPHKRKIPLLPRRRGGSFTLPPCPEPGFRVTAEDLDREKKAALQRISAALGCQGGHWDGRARPPSDSFPLPATVTAPPLAGPMTSVFSSQSSPPSGDPSAAKVTTRLPTKRLRVSAKDTTTPPAKRLWVSAKDTTTPPAKTFCASTPTQRLPGNPGANARSGVGSPCGQKRKAPESGSERFTKS